MSEGEVPSGAGAVALEQIELALLSCENEQLPDHAFHQLRRDISAFITAACDQGPGRGLSLSDHIEVAGRDHKAARRAALLLVRTLGVNGVIPDNDSENQIERKIVHIVEQGLPDLCKAFRINEKKQTYEKYDLIRSIHHTACDRIAPLAALPCDAAGIEVLRQPIQKILSDGMLNAYLQPYDYSRIRAYIETLLAAICELTRIADATFGAKLEETGAKVDEARRYCLTNRSFITDRCFVPFLDAVQQAVGKIGGESSERFACDLAPRRRAPFLAEKKYPLHQTNRLLKISIPFTNTGPGVAVDVVAEIDSTSGIAFDGEIRLGDINPGEFALALSALIVEPVQDCRVVLQVSWGMIGTTARKESLYDLQIVGQDPTIDWADLESREPYSLDVAEGDEFVGRRARVQALANRFLKDRIQSSYITGQKRVGKTSLAHAVERAVKESPKGAKYEILYLEYGAYARMDPVDTVDALGHEIWAFLKCFANATNLEESPSFKGTLAPLNALAEVLLKQDPGRRFLLILDEFDEMHPEMYRFGALAEAFFSNLRALSAKRNMGFLLVGGEKMPFVIGSQGDQLNKLSREQLDYFSRSEEWTDYVDLIADPVNEKLNWSEAAINQVYELTNGHPYYTKLLCSKVYANAVAERDTEITDGDVRHVEHRTVAQLDTNAFAHMWKDGIAADPKESLVIELKRCRLLVAAARALRRGRGLTTDEIVRHKTSGLPEHEIQPLLNEFCRRDVLREVKGMYHFMVPMFSEWLLQTGVTKILLDGLAEELQTQLQAAEDAAYVNGAELAELVSKWPTYRGKQVSAEDVRAWLQQSPNHQNQRILFKVLQNLRFFSQQEIREALRMAHEQMVRPLLPVRVTSKRSERRGDILVTYLDGPGKSGALYASKYAEENSILASCVVAKTNFSKTLSEHETKTGQFPSVVVFVDDIVGTGKTLATNIRTFANENKDAIAHRSLKLVAVVLCATQEGEQHVRRIMKGLDCDVDLRICEPATVRAFPADDDLGIWSDRQEKERAKAHCLDLGAGIYKDAPLGYGLQGLMVVFPDTCPNNSLPILHSGDGHSGRWRPLFPRSVN